MEIGRTWNLLSQSLIIFFTLLRFIFFLRTTQRIRNDWIFFFSENRFAMHAIPLYVNVLSMFKFSPFYGHDANVFGS